MKITCAVIPAIYKQRSGCINVTSSAMGVLSASGVSIYSASKFALEGLKSDLDIQHQMHAN